MKKSPSIALKLIIFAALTALGIIYTFNRSAVDNISHYEKQEMARPDRTPSAIDNLFKFDNDDKDNTSGDDVSLTGKSGRYDEVRIGK